MKLLKAVIISLFLACSAAEAQDIVAVTPSARYNAHGLFEAVFEIDIKSGWHIFAAYGQEFGSPLKIKWTLPKGSEILEESFSRTKRFDLEDFSYDGYENKMFYKATIKAPPALANLPVTVEWQACAEECLPGRLHLAVRPATDNVKFDDILRAAEPYFADNLQSKLLQSLLFILMAFGGGVILNLMPCVFPILSIKIISLIRARPSTRRREALFYTCGVVVSMLAIATILFVLRLFYPLTGWGFQMQSPWFVGLMLVLFIYLSLMMLDIVTVNSGFLNNLAVLKFKNTSLNAFMTGLLAVLVATPCTAPFMGAAIGYALMSPVFVYFPIFIALALGYAFPFALPALYPQLLNKILPKPGHWMITLKKILALPLVITCFWLAWLLAAQTGLIHSGRSLKWQPYSPETVEQALVRRQPVFIDFTAKWCITCLMNKQTVLQSDYLADLVKEKNIMLLRADATLPDETVNNGLKFYGRAGVPLYVYYDGKSPDYLLLPQILTFGILDEYLQ